MNKLLVLGAGVYQLPLIKKAKELGYTTIVVSPKGDFPGFEHSDRIYYEDTKDSQKILEIATKEKVDGICTTGTDVAIPTLGKVVDELGLYGPSYEASINATNKIRMKDKFIDNGVRTAKYVNVSTLEEAHEAFSSLNKPVIFKAIDSSGSRGIVKVTDFNEVENAYSTVMNVTKSDKFIVEEFIDGVEFGAQAFIHNGELKFVLDHGDIMFEGDAGVPIGHYVPYNISHDVYNDMLVQLKKSINAINIDNCAINADFILSNNKVYVLEIGARAGATCLPELVETYYGFDYYKRIIQATLKHDVDFTANTNQPCANELLKVDKSGVLESVQMPRFNNPNIIDISIDCSPGDKINKFKVGPDRVGQIIVKESTVDQALELMEDIKSQINFKLL